MTNILKSTWGGPKKFQPDDLVKFKYDQEISSFEDRDVHNCLLWTWMYIKKGTIARITNFNINKLDANEEYYRVLFDVNYNIAIKTDVPESKLELLHKAKNVKEDKKSKSAEESR